MFCLRVGAGLEPAVLLVSYVSLGKLLKLSEDQLPFLEKCDVMMVPVPSPLGAVTEMGQ